MRDSLYDDTVTRLAMPFALRANGAVNGTTVDKNYQNNRFRALLFSVVAATLTDGTITVTMQDSDDNSTWGAVNATYVQGTLPVIAASSDDTSYDVGYTGDKRYVRLVFTVAGATTGGIAGAVAIMSSARRTPVTH